MIKENNVALFLHKTVLPVVPEAVFYSLIDDGYPIFLDNWVISLVCDLDVLCKKLKHTSLVVEGMNIFHRYILRCYSFGIENTAQKQGQIFVHETISTFSERDRKKLLAIVGGGKTVSQTWGITSYEAGSLQQSVFHARKNLEYYPLNSFNGFTWARDQLMALDEERFQIAENKEDFLSQNKVV